MKKITFLASLAIMMFFGSCSSDKDDIITDENQSVESEQMTVGIGMPGANETRVDFQNDITDMVWNSNDVLIATGYTSTYYPRQDMPKFTLSEGVGTKSGTFKGDKVSWSGSGTTKVYAVNYIFSYIGSKCKYIHPTATWGEPTAETNCLNQVQADGEKGFDHVKDHLFMKTGFVEASAVNGNITKGSILNPKISVARFDFQNIPEAFKGNGTYDISFFINYTEGNDPNAKLNYTGTITAGKHIYLALDPTILDNQKIVRIEISNGTQTFYTQQNARKQVVYGEGKVKTFKIDNAWTWTEKQQAVELQKIRHFIFNVDSINVNNKNWTLTPTNDWKAKFQKDGTLFLQNTTNSSSIAESPIVTLGATQNEAEFELSMVGIYKRELGELLIKDSSVPNAEWTPIKQVVRLYTDTVNGFLESEIKNSEGLMEASQKDKIYKAEIPASFKGKKVKFALRMTYVDYGESNIKFKYLKINGI